MRFSIKMSEVPDHLTVEHVIMERSGIKEHFGMRPERKLPEIIKMNLTDFNPTEVMSSVMESFKKFGWWGFLSHFDDKNVRTADYGGISITHNPQISNGAPEHASALGEPRFNLHDILHGEAGTKVWIDLERRDLINAFYEVVYSRGLPGLKLWLEKTGYKTDWYQDWDKPFKTVKKITRNSYGDSYGFRVRSQGSRTGKLGELLDRFKPSMIRSRIATVKGANWTAGASQKMWHHDEQIFINTRINVPLATAPEFVYEVEGIGIGRFEVGYIYSWNTHKMHRVYATAQTPRNRTHLVIGSAPWFNYLPEDDVWVANEFFGQKHPFDMLLDGDFIEGLTLAPSS